MLTQVSPPHLLGKEDQPGEDERRHRAEGRKDKNYDDTSADDAAARLDGREFAFHGASVALFVHPGLGGNAFSRLGVAGRSSEPTPDRRVNQPKSKEWKMLYWALMFLVIALVAAVFGFGGIASTATGMAQILFVIALVLFIVSLFAGFLRRNL